MKRIITAVLIFALCVGCIGSSATQKIYARSEKDIKEEIYNLSIALRHVFQAKTDSVMDGIEKEIKEKKYDYDLSMDTIEDTDFFQNIDFVEFIAAYVTIKNYYKENNLSFTSLIDVPVLSYKITPKEREEAIPVKIQTCETDANGLFIPGKYKYITEEQTLDYFAENEEGELELHPNETIKPEKRKVKYGEISFQAMDTEDLFAYYDLKKDVVKDDFDARIEKLTKETNDEEIYQTVFAQTPLLNSTVNMDSYYTYYEQANVGDIRVQITKIAQSLIGRVKYQLGGKADHGGYDTSWWTFEGKVQKGLDCSGFVSWVYQTYGFDKDVSDYISWCAHGYVDGVQPITQDSELKVGDIGVYYSNGDYNHVGIYVGKMNGKRMFIHCSSSQGTVTLNSFGFTHYYPAIDLIDEITERINLQHNYKLQNSASYKAEQDAREEAGILAAEKKKELEELQAKAVIAEKEAMEAKIREQEEAKRQGRTSNVSIIGDEKNIQKTVDSENSVKYPTFTQNVNYTQNDILLLAKLIDHEARNEGMNGWIAVAEIVKNRTESSLFPNTISEVIYQKGQFTNSSELSGINPSEEMINTANMVLNGQLSILNRSDCLYFRNPTITSGIKATEQINWGKHEWFTAIGHHAFYLQ